MLKYTPKLMLLNEKGLQHESMGKLRMQLLQAGPADYDQDAQCM